MTELAGKRSPEDVDEPVPVPGFRSWTGLYLFVIGCFVAYVVLFTIFTWTYA